MLVWKEIIMSWVEKFNESHIKAFYITLKGMPKIVLNEWSQARNMDDLRERVSEKVKKNMKEETINQHKTTIKEKLNDYIKKYLLTEEERSEVEQVKSEVRKNRRRTNLILNTPTELLGFIGKYQSVFNALREGDPGCLTPSITYELHIIIKSTLTIVEKISFLSRLIETNPEIINQTDEDGCTPLFTAVAMNQPEIVDFLVGQENIKIDISNYYGWTPFHKAANIGSLEIAQILVESGTMIDRLTRMNANAVYEAAYGCDDINVVKYLVEKQGLDINISTIDQFTPLTTAIWRQNYQIAKYLIESDRLTSINVRDIRDENALYKAISQGCFDLAQILHEKGAEFHRPRLLSSRSITNVNPQKTSFFEAVERDDFRTAKQLIEGETDQNKKEQMVNQVKHPYQRTLLSIAAQNGNQDLVKLLVENGANVFARNNHGRTPKEMVLIPNNEEVYRYLDEQEQIVNPNPSEDELRHRYGEAT